MTRDTMGGDADAEGEEQALMADGHPSGQRQDQDFVPVQLRAANDDGEEDADEGDQHEEARPSPESTGLPLGGLRRCVDVGELETSLEWGKG